MITANAQEMLPKEVQARLLAMPQDMKIGIAVIDASGKTIFLLNAEKELPTASAIKTAILLELFARYDQNLSNSPKEILQILSDPEHLAFAHYSDASKKIMVADLSGVSIKRLGWIMIKKRDDAGKKYSNATYNAATNVAIALLGGPQVTTRLLRNREKSASGITINRYMLANRNTTGDNTATPMAMASLYQKIFGGELRSLPPVVVKEVQRILHSRDDSDGSRLYRKGGTLYSDPVTRVEAGCYRHGDRSMNFAIMCTQPLHESDSGKSQYKNLVQWTRSIYADLQLAFLGQSG